MPPQLPPDPAGAGSFDDLVERLRELKVWAGDPSYEVIKERVNAPRPLAQHARRSTIANAFQSGRRRMNTELVLAVVRVLHGDERYVARWRQALRVVGGEIEAVSQVRVAACLPPVRPGFVGRAEQLDRLREAAGVTVIEGMAGAGKTELALKAAGRMRFERVLFVDLRGFHTDPAQPPADPAAVLDGFLRLLGVPGNRIPHGVDALSAAYRGHLADRPTLVVLDNAATADQVRPLLPDGAALITSRRKLEGLPDATRITLGGLTPDEAVSYLSSAVPETPAGPDPQAAATIARLCGHLPLALGLIAEHIRDSPGWTLTDHADRLRERDRERRLDPGVEQAIDLSYRSVPPAAQRALRLLSLHPRGVFDAHAVAALADAPLEAARSWLTTLHTDHLVEQAGPAAFKLHALVHLYAAIRAHDQDPPAVRQAAQSRLRNHDRPASAPS